MFINVFANKIIVRNAFGNFEKLIGGANLGYGVARLDIGWVLDVAVRGNC